MLADFYTLPLVGRRYIQNLGIKCRHSYKGCGWEGTVETLERHLTTCDFVSLVCPNGCRDKEYTNLVNCFDRHHLQDHLERDCPNREYRCQYCGEEGTYSTITEIHDKTCPKKIVRCPNLDCKVSMLRQDTEKHVRSTCAYTIIPCKYESIGCDVEMKRRDMPDHEQDDKLHLHMALATTLQLREKVGHLETLQRDATTAVAALTQKNAEQKEKIVNLEAFQRDTTNTIALLTQKNAEQKEKIMNLETVQRDATNTIALLTQKSREQETTLSSQQKSIESLTSWMNASKVKVESLERTTALLESNSSSASKKISSNNDKEVPQLIYCFKITNVQSKRESNRDYISQPFYTSDNGYHLAIQVYVNGDSRTNMHVSAFVLVVKGRFDSTLSWPLVGEVTITLLNQREEKNHHSVAVCLKDIHQGGSLGYPFFISHSALDYNPGLNTQYLMNDTLCFRVYFKSL